MRKITLQAGHAYNPSFQETKQGGSGAQGQPVLHKKACLKQNQTKQKQMLPRYIKIILYLMKLCIIVMAQANWRGPFTNEGFILIFY